MFPQRQSGVVPHPQLLVGGLVDEAFTQALPGQPVTPQLQEGGVMPVQLQFAQVPRQLVRIGSQVQGLGGV